MAFVKFQPNLKIGELNDGSTPVITHINGKKINWGINVFEGSLGMMSVTPQGYYSFVAHDRPVDLRDQDEFIFQTNDDNFICAVVNAVREEGAETAQIQIGLWYHTGDDWIHESKLDFKLPINEVFN